MTDGKGVTTLVGLLGCPLKCKYCLNMNVINTGNFKEYSPRELLDAIMIDYCYFVSTGGGITFGGAEPLLQIEALFEFIELLPEHVSLNIESCLNVAVKKETFEALANKVNQFIIDVKTLDKALYLEYTGKTNDLTLENINRICQLGYQDKCRIRIPIIPKYKTEDTAYAEAVHMRELGFNNVEVFHYVIRNYME